MYWISYIAPFLSNSCDCLRIAIFIQLSPLTLSSWNTFADHTQVISNFSNETRRNNKHSYLKGVKHDFSSYSTRLVAIFGKVRPDTAVVVFLFSFNRILFSLVARLSHTILSHLDHIESAFSTVFLTIVCDIHDSAQINWVHRFIITNTEKTQTFSTEHTQRRARAQHSFAHLVFFLSLFLPFS